MSEILPGDAEAAFLRSEVERLTRERDEAIRQIGPRAAENERLRGALEALGVMPDGYCFCSTGRDPYRAHHEPECRDARAALAGEGEENVAEDSYFYMAELLEPHTRRQGGSLPASVVESFQMLLEHWTKSRAGEGAVPERKPGCAVRGCTAESKWLVNMSRPGTVLEVHICEEHIDRAAGEAPIIPAATPTPEKAREA